MLSDEALNSERAELSALLRANHMQLVLHSCKSRSQLSAESFLSLQKSLCQQASAPVGPAESERETGKRFLRQLLMNAWGRLSVMRSR